MFISNILFSNNILTLTTTLIGHPCYMFRLGSRFRRLALRAACWAFPLQQNPHQDPGMAFVTDWRFALESCIQYIFLSLCWLIIYIIPDNLFFFLCVLFFGNHFRYVCCCHFIANFATFWLGPRVLLTFQLDPKTPWKIRGPVLPSNSTTPFSWVCLSFLRTNLNHHLGMYLIFPHVLCKSKFLLGRVDDSSASKDCGLRQDELQHLVAKLYRGNTGPFCDTTSVKRFDIFYMRW